MTLATLSSEELYERWQAELCQLVREPDTVLIASLEFEATRRGFSMQAVSGLLGAFGPFDPDLHPRGKDGKFIEALGLVNIFGLSGFQHGQRGDKRVQGQVQEILPSGKKGDPIIRVKLTDPRWDAAKFGPTIDVH